MTAEIDEDRSPAYGAEAFECPWCSVYARQMWKDISSWGATEGALFWRGWRWSECFHCKRVGLWSHQEKLVWPEKARFGPEANLDMPKNVRDLYDEARAVFPISPRAAAGLLRLALQVLIDTLEPNSKSLNEKIRRLVARGLEPTARKAMDVLRVVGNNAVHPGEIQLDGDQELVPALFVTLNLIVHHVLSRPKQVDHLFDSLPDNAKNSIERRDKESKVVQINKSRSGGAAAATAASG